MDAEEQGPLVLTERRGAVLVITLNRPARLNAWTNDMEDQYFDELDRAEADPLVRAIVVTGSGRAFCAGADMDVLASASDGSMPDRPGERRPVHYPLGLRKPLIAAVNGAAAGLGFVQALYADIRFASAEAAFLTSFVRRGLIAEYGSAWMLSRLVGQGRARDLLLSGRRVDGVEAFRMGLVEHLAPAETLLAEATHYAQELATWCSPMSMATIKSQLALDAERSFGEAAVHAEALMLQSFTSADLPEGVASFTYRRPPAFQPLLPKEITWSSR